MLILETTRELKPTRRPTFSRGLVYFGVSASVLIAISPIAFAIFSKSPTGTLDSPLPKTEQAAAPTETTTPLPIPSAYSALLTSASDHLDKAIETSLNPLTPESKTLIANELNQSLADASAAINTRPDLIDGYLKRASIYTAISKIKPETLRLAKDDLALAQSLNRGQVVDLANLTTPIIFDSSSLPNKVSIAAPAASSSTAQNPTSDVSSNASQNTFIFPSGKQETVITDANVKNTTYIYLIPKTKTNNPIYVTSKSTGSFTVTSSSPSSDDIAVDYYLINQ